MRVLPGFDPSLSLSGEIDISNAEVDGKILMYNESPITMKLDFLNGNTDLIHANEAKWWLLDGETPSIGWSFYSKIDYGGNTVAISELTLTLFSAREDVPGTYPVSLTRQVSFGSAVPLMSSATSVVNDFSLPNTPLVEGTPTGGTPPRAWGTSPTLVKNDGNIDLGNVVVAGTLTLGGGISAPTTPNVLDGLNGLTLANGGVQFSNGSISQFRMFSGSSINGKVTVAHHLSVVPDCVLIVFNSNGIPSGAIGIQFNSLTSTTCDVWANVASNFVAVAIKF